MNHYVLIASSARGSVNPPGRVSEEDERMINARVEQEWYYATLERDPPLSQWRERMGALNPQARDRRDKRNPAVSVKSVEKYFGRS